MFKILKNFNSQSFKDGTPLVQCSTMRQPTIKKKKNKYAAVVWDPSTNTTYQKLERRGKQKDGSAATITDNQV